MGNISQQEQLVLHLSLIDGVGPSTIQKVIDRKPDMLSWGDYYSINQTELQRVCVVSERSAKKIVEGLRDFAALENELNLIEKNNVQLLSIVSEAYPEILRHIHQPPPVIYLQGASIKNNENRIAVIGSRKANRYAKQAIGSLIPALVGNNWIIVSGGAIGADTMAHTTALDAGGKTIIVLGSGLLRPYPHSNKKLFARALESGSTIISPFPLTMSALPQHFPSRNRIIAGLSQGCLVVQAAEKSGTRITAQFALDQGREVFAIPGPIDEPLSRGCHKLIQDGAKLVGCIDDILIEFGQEAVEQDSSHQLSIQTDGLENLSDIQKQLLLACKNPRSIDELSLTTHLPLSQLNHELFNLQLDGKVLQDFTGKWITSHH